MKHFTSLRKPLRKLPFYSRISKKSSSLKARVRRVFKGPESDATPRRPQRKRRISTSISKKTSSTKARIRRVFKGPQSNAPRQPEAQEQTRYQHKPTHSASSFLKTATTAVMIEPVTDQSDDITLAERETLYIPEAHQRDPLPVSVI